MALYLGSKKVGVTISKAVGGVELPTLTNEGSAADLRLGKQLIDSNGNIVNGTHECEGGIELPTLTNEATAADLIKGKQLIGSSGNIINGTMTNNGAITSTMDGIDTKSVSIPAGYTSGGTVSLTDDIDNEVDTQADLIAQISSVLNNKAIGGSGINCATGTVTSDEYGVITFPELDFTPTIIAIWNIVKRDLKAEAEANGEEWDEENRQYMYDGVMLFAIYSNDSWISQALSRTSGAIFISNTSGQNYNSTINFDGINYSYGLGRHDAVSGDSFYNDFTDVEFNYAIYG